MSGARIFDVAVAVALCALAPFTAGHLARGEHDPLTWATLFVAGAAMSGVGALWLSMRAEDRARARALQQLRRRP